MCFVAGDVVQHNTVESQVYIQSSLSRVAQFVIVVVVMQCCHVLACQVQLSAAVKKVEDQSEWSHHAGPVWDARECPLCS